MRTRTERDAKLFLQEQAREDGRRSGSSRLSTRALLVVLAGLLVVSVIVALL